MKAKAKPKTSRKVVACPACDVALGNEAEFDAYIKAACEAIREHWSNRVLNSRSTVKYAPAEIPVVHFD